MKVDITIDMAGESLERQLEIMRHASRLAEETRTRLGTPEGNVPETVDSYKECQRKEGLETTISGLDVVEPTMYDIFLNMSCYEFGRFIRNWIRRHLKDDELCIGRVERIFQTPVSIYKQHFSHLNKK